MKISFVVSTQPTHFEAVTFSPDFEANAARLAELGYDGVELAVRDPSVLDVKGIRRVIEKYNLRVPAVGTGQAWGEDHLSFTDPDRAIRERALQRVKSHLAFASEFAAIVILGLVRGRVQPGVSPDQAHTWLVDALRVLAGEADTNRVRLMLEPINRYETNLLNTAREARALIEETAAQNLGILYDTFHSNIEEPDMDGSLRACGSHLFHVHLADSNRWAPGAGHIDFGSIIRTLRQMEYAGWVSAEILPKPDIAHAQEQTIRTMRPLLQD